MRADRLLAALLLMQARGTITAGELAGALEVSVATARRDLEALSTAGVPVYPQRGRGGGWQLVGGARTDLSGLNFTEMQALFAALGSESSGSPELVAATRKLVGALPDTFRDPALAALSAVVVDREGWGQEPAAESELRSTIRSAVIARRRLRFRYRDRTIDVEPWGLVDKSRTWYLIAAGPDGRRTYRVDRMSRLEVLETAFIPPEDLDLEVIWREVRERLEARRNAVAAVVLAPPYVVGPLRDVLGARHVRDLGEEPDGRRRLEVGSNTVEMLARQLAGWQPEVEVTGPAEVRAALATLGSSLAERYGG